MPEPIEISKIKAGKPTSGKSHVNVNPTIDAPKTQGGDTPAKQTLNRIAKPPKLKAEGFSPAASVMYAQKGTLAKTGIQRAPAPKLPTTKDMPKMMTGPKTARSYARRLARITPANSVQKTTQGTSLPGANFMASETKNESKEITTGQPGQHKPDPDVTYHGLHKQSGLHRFHTKGEGMGLYAKHKPGSGDAGWHIKMGNHVYEYARGLKEEVDVKKWPQGPNDLDPLATTELKAAMASNSMRSLKQNLQWALKKDDPDHNVDPDGAVMDQIAGAPYNKSDGGPAVSTEELLGLQHKTGEYKFESTEESLEEVSDELLYRAQSKAHYLSDKARTLAKKYQTKHLKKVKKGEEGFAKGKDWDTHVKYSDEASSRSRQATRFFRARGTKKS